jgi:hypothetical protein
MAAYNSEEARMADASSAAEGRPARRPLRISDALAAWGTGLLVVGCVAFLLAVGALALMARTFTAGGLVIITMIALSGIPVFIAVLLIVGRALVVSTAQFVTSVVSTPLVALDPPPRPDALASPLAMLRFLRLIPALVAALMFVLIATGIDVAFLVRGNQSVRIGAYAATLGGLAALIAVLLALGWGIFRLGGALTRRERELGARFFVLRPEQEAAGGATAEVAVCAVPGEA